MNLPRLSPQRKREIKALLLVSLMLVLLFIVSIGTMVYGFGITPISWPKVITGYLAMFVVQGCMPFIKI